jgi:heterodisulfide reductase subunit A
MERAVLGPVESTSRGVFFCGTVIGPHEVLDSIAQGSAAAAKASTLLSQPSVQLEPSVAVVDAALCRGCGACVDVCAFHAPGLVDQNGTMVSSINPALCQGCGTCAVGCPTGAIEPQHFTRSQMLASLDALLEVGVSKS